MPILIGGGFTYPVNWIVVEGQVTPQELIDLPGRIHPELPEFGPTWLTYLAADADLSGISVPIFVELKALLRPRVTALAGGGEFRVALVSGAEHHDLVVSFWRDYVGYDPDYPSDPYFTKSLQRAFEHLGVTGEQQSAIEDAIRAALRM